MTAQLKYVRTTKGFLVFPPLVAAHAMVAAATGWPKLSAGFVEWDVDGLPLCMGRSESLGIDSQEGDTAALRAEWGIAALDAAPAERVEAWQPIETAPLDTDILLGWWITWPETVWETESAWAGGLLGCWRHGRATHWMPLPAPPALLADAAAIAGIPLESLEKAP
jgi:hypothetical protein